MVLYIDPAVIKKIAIKTHERKIIKKEIAHSFKKLFHFLTFESLFIITSKPSTLFEIQIRADGREDHEAQGERVGPRHGEFGHVGEVHAINRSDQGRRHEHHGGDREEFDDGVLFDVDHAERGL